MPIKPTVSADGRAVTLTLTAKDAEGLDVASTNGLLTVEYDGAEMMLTDVQVGRALSCGCPGRGDGEAGLRRAAGCGGWQSCGDIDLCAER
ncbi:MAG: hypothetical protein ACLU9S_20615 [Oscillospiraceae bacterium]